MEKGLVKIISEGTFWTTAGMWLVKVVGIVYSLVVISQLSLYQYGLVELIISIPILISFLGLPGLETVVIADIGVEKGNRNRQAVRNLFESYIILRIILALVGWVLIFFGAGLIATYYNDSIELMVKIVSFTFIVGLFRSLVQILFRFELKFRALASLHFLEEVIKLCIVVIGFWVYGADPIVVAVAYVGAEAVALIVFIPVIYKSLQKVFESTTCTVNVFSAWRLLSAHAKWSVFGSYLNNFSQSIRLWFIKVFISTEAVAIFSVAMGLFQQTGGLMPLHKVIAPIIPQYVAQKELFNKLIDKGIKYQILSYALIGVFGAVVFPIILGHLFPQYESAFWLYQIILIALLPSGFSAVIQSVFYAYKAQRNLFFAQVSITLVTIILLPMALTLFGILGAALEIVLTRTLYSLERYRRVKKILPDFKLNAKDFIEFDDMDRRLLSYAHTKTFGRFM